MKSIANCFSVFANIFSRDKLRATHASTSLSTGQRINVVSSLVFRPCVKSMLVNLEDTFVPIFFSYLHIVKEISWIFVFLGSR